MVRGYSAFNQFTAGPQPAAPCVAGVAGDLSWPAGVPSVALAAGASTPTHAVAAAARLDSPTGPVLTDVDETPQPAPSSRPAPRGALALKHPWVVVIKSALRPAQPLECRVAESSRCAGRLYRVDTLMASGLDCLSHLYDTQAPRVLVVDLALVDPALTGSDGADTLQQHRRRMPATDLLLAGDATCLADRALVVRSQARGCIDWSIGSAQFGRALDAVLAGELWFTRKMLQALYLAFLEAGPPGSTANAQAIDDSNALTAREAEVLACMRHGMTNKQIAERLGISVNTVKKHLAHVYEKRGVHNGRQFAV